MNVEKAKELKSSTLWTSVCAEIQAMIDATREQMDSCKKEDFERLQERVKTLKEVQMLPQHVIDRLE